jgi:hypothetical protein
MSISPLQAMVDGMTAQWQKDRAETQMTLGKLIAALEAFPQDKQIVGFGSEYSYRGYYSDLSFEPSDEPQPVKRLLDQCKGAMGQVYRGYKGGDYMMGANTPVWVADYGCTGKKIVGLNDGDVITVETKEDDYL